MFDTQKSTGTLYTSILVFAIAAFLFGSALSRDADTFGVVSSGALAELSMCSVVFAWMNRKTSVQGREYVLVAVRRNAY